MKEMPFIVLGLIILVAAALFLGSSDPISAAVAQAEVSGAATAIPAVGWLTSKVTSTLFGIVLSGIVLGIAGVAIVEIRRWLKEREKGQWRGGPNARWQRQAPPRQAQMTTDDLMKLLLIRQLGSSGGAPLMINPPEDDDPNLEF